MTAARPLAAYGAVTASYWAFMLTDGALRMLVLLHFHTLGFSPVQLAYLFVLYEVAGVVTNLCAGWIAKRFGLMKTLHLGLAIQILALLTLATMDPSYSIGASVVFVMLVQGLSGVAKDLTKMSSKSAVKLIAPAQEGALFRWVAALTGSKNAVKGLGFFLGAVLLGSVGFVFALVLLAVVLGAVWGVVSLVRPKGLPAGVKAAKFREVLSSDARINWLSAARLFLFGARDVWFVVGIPIYFYAVLSDGTTEGNRAAFFAIGSFMAVWIILYGVVQASAPKLLRAKGRSDAEMVARARWLVGGLALIPLALAGIVAVADGPSQMLTLTIVAGLLLFGFVFALNSALHSYLILAFTTSERVTMDVGFYYMANAGGRLVGTVLSGASYQFGGLAGCLATAALFCGLSWLSARRLGNVAD